MLRRFAWLVLATGACSRAPSEPASSSSTPPSSAAASSGSARAAGDTAPALASQTSGLSSSSGTPSPAGRPTRELPLLWNDPPSFRRVTPRSPARAAEYATPRAGADPEEGECVIMTFGPTQGGSVDDNVKRWVDQFHPALPTPRRANMEVNGMKTTFVEVAGTFAGNMMPTQQGVSTPTNKPAWRLLGAIVESPSGLWFFKLTGPDLTVRAGARDFEDMVRSARPR